MNQRRKHTDVSANSKARGARASKISTWQLLRSWWRHHRNSCMDSLCRLLSTPLQSLLTWLVIAIALALPTALYLGLKNFQHLGQNWQDNAQMSVFLKQGVQAKAIDNLIKRLQANANISSIDWLTPNSALVEFQQYSGLGNVLQDLDENPLPNVLILQPAPAADTPEKIAELRMQLQKDPLVDNIQLDMNWLKRLHELLALGERIVFALGILLSLGVLLVIGNTLRLAIENRREEIIVTKTVGGTNGFVRRPFLYTGFWYGLGGGFLASLLLLLLGYWLASPVDNLIHLYESDYSFHGLRASFLFTLLAGSGFLGWLGAWLAVSRHLRAIEPK